MRLESFDNFRGVLSQKKTLDSKINQRSDGVSSSEDPTKFIKE